MIKQGGILVVYTEERIEDCINQYGDMALRVAYSYLNHRQDAEDAVQELFVKMLEKHPEFNDKEHEKAWILRTTINLCKNKLKSFWRKNMGGLQDQMKYYDQYNENDFVMQAVMSLPPQYRIVIYLYYFEAYKTPEIAKILDKKEVTVRSFLHRARERLKQILKEEYDFEE